jgi:hypothetical protein
VRLDGRWWHRSQRPPFGLVEEFTDGTDVLRPPQDAR